MNAEYIYSSLCPSCPHFPTWYAPFSLPHTAHLLARTELSPLSFSNEPQALGKTPVSLPKTQLQLHQSCSRPFYMKRSSMLLFTAVESQLSERYAGSQLSHTVRRDNHSVVSVTTDSCICLFNGQVGRGHSSSSNNVIDQEPASCQKLTKKIKITFLGRPQTSLPWPSVILTIKRWATSSYAIAPRRKGMVSPPTGLIYLEKTR